MSSTENQPLDAKTENLTQCGKDKQWVQYFKDAEDHIHEQWEKLIWPQIKDFDFTTTLELAPGGGRNTSKLLPLAKTMHLVDMNKYCIDLCRERFASQQGDCEIHFHVNDGVSFEMIEDASVTALYTWDSAVHMDKAVIKAYLPEMKRVLAPGAKAFIHHSNYGSVSDSAEFKKNPHWRTNMSAALMKDYCSEIGLDVIDQTLIPWGEDIDLDCISILRRP